MYFKPTFVAAAFATLAVATPLTIRTDEPIPASQCNTGPVQCCNSSSTANDKAIAGLLSLLGVVVGDITALIGVTCSPITAIGVGGDSCTAQPLCCENNSFNGLISLGCIPVNINL